MQEDLTSDVMNGLGEVVRNGNGLATCARWFWFTSAAEKTFPMTSCTVGGATARARQMSQGEAIVVLD